MRTLLFPKNNAPITMVQGNVGDCYLIATIDCIANGSPQGYEFIKSMFEETDTGVYVRVPHNPLRKNVEDKKQEGKLDGKYVHHYDASSGKDVFFIPNESLDRIDAYADGVTTNSLAVKILEHIITYYYNSVQKTDSASEDEEEFDDSIIGHASKGRYSGTSTVFVGHFLGVHLVDLKADDIHKVIKFRSFRPTYPVYISISTTGMDAYGNPVTRRHALRLVEIVPSDGAYSGGYEFIFCLTHIILKNGSNTTLQSFQV